MRKEKSKEKVLNQLKSMGVFNTKDAVNAGLSQSTLSRYVKTRKLIRVGRGLYLHPETSIPIEERDFAVACAKFGNHAVIGGMTALFYYGLIDQVPSKIWILVKPQNKTSHSLYRCLRTKNILSSGIIDKKYFKITNIERTIVESFRYGTKIGLSIVFKAVRKAMHDNLTNEVKILREAKELGLEQYVKKYWDAIIPESMEW